MILANSHSVLNRHADALKLQQETVAAQRRVLPHDHPETLTTLNNLANSLAALNRHPEAVKLHEETLAIRRRVLPPDHTDVPQSLGNVANSYAALNRHADAFKLREETLAGQRRVLPPDHPHTLQCMNSLATSYLALGRPAEALKLNEETLVARKRVLPPDHPHTLTSMVNLAQCLVQLDRGSEAIPLLDEAIAKARVNPAVNPRLIPLAFSQRWHHVRKTADPAGCRTTAEMWEMLNRTDAGGLHAAARFRAVAAGVQAKAPGADAVKLARDDADRAMQWLHRAVQAGFRDAAHMKKDTDLDALRERDDFKKLLAKLEAKK